MSLSNVTMQAAFGNDQCFHDRVMLHVSNPKSEKWMTRMYIVYSTCDDEVIGGTYRLPSLRFRHASGFYTTANQNRPGPVAKTPPRLSRPADSGRLFTGSREAAKFSSLSGGGQKCLTIRGTSQRGMLGLSRLSGRRGEESHDAEPSAEADFCASAWH